MRVFCSTTDDGNMDFRFGERAEVEENRKRFLEKCGVSHDMAVAVMQVEHGVTITPVSTQKSNSLSDTAKNYSCFLLKNSYVAAQSSLASSSKEFFFATTPNCDALVTDDPHTALMLLTADCYPVSFFDPVHNVVALAHMGWRPTGLLLGEKVVQTMHTNYGSQSRDIQVQIGPGISKESYVVENPSQKDDPLWQPYMHPESAVPGAEKDMWHIDLLQKNIDQLVSAGVPKDHIQVASIDTVTSAGYFSHYRTTRMGGVPGRFATVVTL